MASRRADKGRLRSKFAAFLARTRPSSRKKIARPTRGSSDRMPPGLKLWHGGLRILHSSAEPLHFGRKITTRPALAARCERRRGSCPGQEPRMSKVTHAKLIIIGSGPAGCTAAIYAARAMLEPIMIRGMQAGGQLTITTDVENYPGFAEVIQGPWLMEQMEKQAEHVGTRLVADHVTKLDLSQRPFRLECDSGDVYLADAVVLATGAQARWLELPSRAEVQGLRRLGLRDLRRLLLPRQGSDGDRRRQHRGRGSAVPDQLRREGDRGAPARSFPRRENPAGPAVQESEDLGDLGHRAARRARRRQSAEGEGRRAEEREDRRDHREGARTACSSRSAIRRRPNS